MKKLRTIVLKWLFKNKWTDYGYLEKYGTLRTTEEYRQIVNALRLSRDLDYLIFDLYKSKERPCGEVPRMDEKTRSRFDAVADSEAIERILAMWDEMRRDEAERVNSDTSESPKDWEAILKAELPFPDSVSDIYEDETGISFTWNMNKYMLDTEDGCVLTLDGKIWRSDNSCLLITHILRRHFAK
jgi:hypothetical protein